jgi:hypothetical protein
MVLPSATEHTTVLPDETQGNAGPSFWCKFKLTPV